MFIKLIIYYHSYVMIILNVFLALLIQIGFNNLIQKRDAHVKKDLKMWEIVNFVVITTAKLVLTKVIHQIL